MPGMDGKACLKALKKHPRLKEIPVIIYTTSSAREDREETAKLGAAYFLTKPASMNGLREGLAKAIEAVAPG